MAQTPSKVPVTREKSAAPMPQAWQPLDAFHRQIDRLFDDVGRGNWPNLFAHEPRWWPSARLAVAAPAVDVAESEKAYEITAELPGMDEKNVEVKVVDGSITIKGEKQEEKEEKKKDYYLHERHYGAFERSFTLPDGVDADKIEASFKKGVLTVTLPKKPEAQKPAKKIEVKAG
jgi:HSP20 family protein